MSRPKRLYGFDYRGACRYFLTLCCHRRVRAFNAAPVVDSTRELFLQSGSEEGFEILAYCFMPDHLHLVVEGVEDRAGLKRFLKVARQRSAVAYAATHGHRLWQDGYYDRILRREDDVVAIVRYVLENPVRAGLVAHPLDYPYLGSSILDVQDLLESSQRRCPN